MKTVLFKWLLAFVAFILLPSFPPTLAAAVDNVRLKDLGRISGLRDNALVGYGLVTGLAGSGDSSRNKATRQSLANMLSRFNLTLSADDIQSRNAAAVMVTASLPPFAKPGDTLDVTVTSVGDARSLAGGLLILAPLSGPDGKIHALAQGPISVGGYKYDQNGNVVQKNHPTTGSIPGGASVEVGVDEHEAEALHALAFILSDPDYTTANRIATAINTALGAGTAKVRDASAVDIRLTTERPDSMPEFIGRIEGLEVQPDIRAKVVINERTGTVVAGGDARISKVSISHGDLKVSIVTTNLVSQPLLARQAGPGVHTEMYSNSRITVEENGDSAFLNAPGNSVTDLVQALNRIKINTRDIISILRAVKAAGALHADLVIQ